jgi:hypothetical protein
MAGGGTGRGNVESFRAQTDALAKDLPRQTLAVVAEYVLSVRDLAEDNSRSALGFSSRPDPWNQPRIQDSWWAGSTPRGGSPPSMTEESGPCDSAGARTNLYASAKLGDDLWVWSNNFRTFFHEYGYYSRTGGARPKWMLRNAIVAASADAEQGKAA